MKKIIGGLTILSMLLVMLASCSVNGTPASLVGKWKVDGGITTMEIKSDDTVAYGGTCIKDNKHHSPYDYCSMFVNQFTPEGQKIIEGRR